MEATDFNINFLLSVIIGLVIIVGILYTCLNSKKS